MSNFTTLYPALLFPAIPLMMISFGNRYTSLASLIRKIHDLIVLNKHSKKTAGHYFDQIAILTKRLKLVRAIQTLSGLSFLSNLFSILFSEKSGNNKFYYSIHKILSYSLLKITDHSSPLQIR